MLEVMDSNKHGRPLSGMTSSLDSHRSSILAVLKLRLSSNSSNYLQACVASLETVAPPNGLACSLFIYNVSAIDVKLLGRENSKTRHCLL